MKTPDKKVSTFRNFVTRTFIIMWAVLCGIDLGDASFAHRRVNAAFVLESVLETCICSAIATLLVMLVFQKIARILARRSRH